MLFPSHHYYLAVLSFIENLSNKKKKSTHSNNLKVAQFSGKTTDIATLVTKM